MDSDKVKKLLDDLNEIPLNLSREYYYINKEKKKIIEEIINSNDKQEIEAVLKEIKKEQ